MFVEEHIYVSTPYRIKFSLQKTIILWKKIKSILIYFWSS